MRIKVVYKYLFALWLGRSNSSSILRYVMRNIPVILKKKNLKME
jgi:hypothetical protein